MAETMGDRIRMHRARLRWTQAQLGQKVGLSTNAISAIENGETDPRVSRFMAIADALDVGADDLFYGDASRARRTPGGATSPQVPCRC